MMSAVLPIVSTSVVMYIFIHACTTCIIDSVIICIQQKVEGAPKEKFRKTFVNHCKGSVCPLVGAF